MALRVVPALDQTLRVLEDRGFVFDHAVRRQPAGAGAHAHRAARRVEAHADLMRGFDAVVQRDAVRVDVQVVAAGGAAGEKQLGHRGLRRHPHHFRRQMGPDRVERLQPPEQLAVLRGRHHARQRLVHVVVRVHQPGDDDLVACVDDLVGRLRQLHAGADRFDDAAAREDRTVDDLAPLRVHRDEQARVTDKQRLAHRSALNAPRPPWRLRWPRPRRPWRR